MKPITLEEYKEHGPEFFEKFNYVKNEMGFNSKAEDVLKVMESLAGLVMSKRKEKSSGPMGFNKETEKPQENETPNDSFDI